MMSHIPLTWFDKNIQEEFKNINLVNSEIQEEFNNINLVNYEMRKLGLIGGNPTTYSKTSMTYTGKDKVVRSVYVKHGKKYIKKKSAKTGKFTYRPIKA